MKHSFYRFNPTMSRLDTPVYGGWVALARSFRDGAKLRMQRYYSVPPPSHIDRIDRSTARIRPARFRSLTDTRGSVARIHPARIPSLTDTRVSVFRYRELGGTTTSKSDPLIRRSSSCRTGMRGSGATESAHSMPLSATNVPYR